MPGIVGIITTNPNTEEVTQQLRTMLACMAHEPFYTFGAYAVREMGCHVGWVSRTEAASCPNLAVDSTGQVALIFSGEHLGDSSISDASPGSAAADILERYLRNGDEFVEELNGWFSGVLIDRNRQAVVLFLDRFGMHRVYWAATEDSFSFGSEAKALLAIRPECRALDSAALGQFLTFGSVFGHRSLFQNVSLLPAASVWAFKRSATPSRRTYFSPAEWERQPVLPADGYYEELKATVRRVVPRYVEGCEPVAMSLTAGLDTRIIMAAAGRDPGSLPCYTYRGPHRDCFDVRAAADVARACGQPHQAIPLESDFFAHFPALAERTVWLTDGTQDITGTHELYFSSRARRIAPIRLTGNYGSEVLRGVSTFKPTASSEAISEDLRPFVKEALALHRELRSAPEVTFASWAEIPWHLYGRLALAQSQLTVRSPYMDNALVRLAYQVPAALRHGSELSLRLISELDPRLAGVETDMGFRASGPSLTTLPRRLSRYVLFKAEWYYNLGMPAWLTPADRPVLKKLQPLFLGTHKIEYYRVWFRDQLAEYMRSMLSSVLRAGRGYAEPARCLRLLNSRRLSGDDASTLGRLVALELVHTHLMQPGSPSPNVRVQAALRAS
jgi:asparagine synthase (glutamine-hydrolysing)